MVTKDWMQTFTGRQFFPTAPHRDAVEITDIAHALSLICRFGGHCRQFYSVAQHSVLVLGMVRKSGKLRQGNDYMRAALLHDAAEAYLGDMVRSLKKEMPDYRAAELAVMEHIRLAFKCEIPVHDTFFWDVLKAADIRILAAEYRDLMLHSPTAYWGSIEGVQVNDIPIIKPMSPEVAELEFLSAFYQLQD